MRRILSVILTVFMLIASSQPVSPMAMPHVTGTVAEGGNFLIPFVILGAALFGWARPSAKKVTKSEVPSERGFRDYLNNYYRSPAPELAPRMLEAYLASKPDPHNPNWPVLYFFIRVAQLHPAVNRGYEALFDGTSAAGKAVVLRILELSADEKTVQFLRSKLKDKRCAELWSEIEQNIQKGLPLKITVLQRPVEDSGDMDVRWAEFLVTGQPQAVVPIIDVLEWPDLLRQKLNDWLSGRLGPLPTPAEREQVQRRVSEALGMSLSVEQDRVRTAEDLDYLSVLSEGRVAGERLQKVAAALPFPLSNEERQRMAAKAVAKWSLESNAMQHRAILTLCEEQAGRRSGRAQLALLEIAGRGWSAGREYERAAKALRSYLQVSSANNEVRILLELADAEIQLTTLGTLSEESAVRDTGDIPADLVLKAAAITRAARSYACTTLLNFHGGGEEGNIEWRADFVSPDKYHVQQAGWRVDREKGDFDEWITLGRDHYDNMGIWVKLSEDSRKQRMELNPFLRVDKFLTVMSGDLRPARAGIFSFRDRRYLMIEYQTKVPAGFSRLPQAVDQVGRFRIWIDWEHQRLAKGELEFESSGGDGKRVKWKMQEVFAGYGIELPIAPPQQVLEATAPK